MIPKTATFRRAEGLTIAVTLCSGTEAVRLFARRQQTRYEAMLTREDVRLLGRISKWSTAADLQEGHARLVSLAERNCAFWSRSRPERNLTGSPLLTLRGRVGLRRNVRANPLIGDRTGSLGPIPTMPRRGTLDDAELAGVQFTVAEMDTDVFDLVFGCCARHGQVLRDLVPALDGRSKIERLLEREETRTIVEILNELGLLERRTIPRWNGAPRITWMGHAGVLYEATSSRVAIDPLEFHPSEPTRHTSRPFDMRNIGDLTAIVITHGDNDHFNPSTLMRINKNTPVIIPKTTTPRPYQVDIERVLQILRFTNVIPLSEWKSTHVGDVDVIAVPFRGEDWGLTLSSSAFIVKSAHSSIYLNADSVSTPDAYRRIRKRFHIDIAFVGVTGAAEAYAMPPGFGYGEFYRDWIPIHRHNEWVELCNGPADAAKAAAMLGARFVFGYAAGGGSFYRLAYSDRGSHHDLRKQLERVRSGPRPLDLALAVPTSIPDHNSALVGRTFVRAPRSERKKGHRRKRAHARMAADVSVSPLR